MPLHESAGARIALLHVLATVDRDIGAGHEAGIVRAQVEHERRHFLRLVEAPTGICGSTFVSRISCGIAVTIFVAR
jgi:hypothetical protein